MNRFVAYGIIFITLFLLAAPHCCLAAQVSEKAPEFELDDLQGAHHKLSDYRGKVVMINFWASWCPECIEEMSSLNALYERYRGKGLVVLAISADRKKDAAMTVLARTHVSYPVLLDTTGGVFIRHYTVVGLPTTIVIDKNGFIDERILGRTDFSSPTFVKKIEGLISGRKQ
jgi:peroxiredoxin